jgi:hypothetical protein
MDGDIDYWIKDQYEKHLDFSMRDTITGISIKLLERILY